MRDQEIIGLWEAYQQVHTQEEVEQLDEAITSEKGKAKASAMIAARSTPSGRAKSGKGENVAQIKHIERSDTEGLRGTPMTPTMAKNPIKSRSGFRGTGNKAARRAAELKNEEFDLFDVILEHLVAEGYADTNKAALAIMANMSEEWKQSIVEETKRTEYLQKKFNKENERKSGSAHTAIPGKQNTGQALYKARQSERHMRGEK